MGGSVLRLVVCAAVALLAAMLLSSCGGADSPAGVATGPLRISSGGIAAFREPGANNSLEEYGHEATRVELEQAAANVHAYLAAVTSEEWRAACAAVSRELVRSLGRVFKSGERPASQSCAEMIRGSAGSEAPLADTPYKSSEVDAGSLRIEGDTGFLFFNAVAGGLQILVLREGGKWKVDSPYPAGVH